jgi:carbamate kinase
MRPKVEAAVAFVRGGGQRAYIAHLEHGLEALRGETGTTITGVVT